MPFPALILEIVLDFLYSGQARRLTGIDTLLYNKISSVTHGLAALRGLAQEEAIFQKVQSCMQMNYLGLPRVRAYGTVVHNAF